MFNTFLGLFRNRWVRTFLGVLVFAVLVWFFGPLLGFGSMHPLETEVARYIFIGALFVLWLVMNLMAELRASKKDKDLANGIAAPDAAVVASATASAEEVALLSDRMREAVKTLKSAKIAGGSRKRLASLPWYMFIGPPGAGKTTALLNCGLKFPLADAGGGHAVKGVGGTRNCDWWFTDDAVLIDTAGRYTTQDSQQAVDNAAWLGFLKLLKKHRKRQPLNGVLVAISLTDLATLNEDGRLTHARAVRKRIKELQDELGVRVPVYVLFTKADMIQGFVEFFDNMGREEREQVWGTTFQIDDGKDEEGIVAAFPKEFDALLARLNDRMLERVHQEPDVQRRRLVYGFPQQVASMRDIAAEFLTETFRPSRLEARSLLRGVYFTSGTQDGTPIDRLLGTMSSEFGLPRPAVTAFSGAGRSYFLTRLIKEVVFGEAALVGLDRKVERRNKMISYGVYATCALILLGLAGSWTASFVGNRGLIADVHAATTLYNGQIAELAKRGQMDADITAPVPALNTLRAIPGGYEQRDNAIPVSLTFGLYQGDKLGTAASDAYVRALNGLLLPRMIARVEGQMVAGMKNADFLYQALKVYLILGRKGPLDRELVMQWFLADLLASFPNEDQTVLREALANHADAMLQQPLSQVALNDELVRRARDILNREPLAEYSYNRIMRSKRVLAIPDWTVAENGGPGSSRVFVLRSGKTLDNGVKGIYTWAGYHNVFLALLPTVTQDLTEDAWVLGRSSRDVTAVLRDTAKLRRDVMGLYLDDYVRVWDRMLQDISIKNFSNITQALDTLSLLSAPASPLRDLLISIDAQTQLSRPAASDAAVAAAQAKAAKVGQRATGFAAFEARSGLSLKQNELVNILGEAFGSDPAGKPIDPATRVDAYFKSLHDFVTAPDGRPAPMEAMLQKMQQMYQNFNQVANAPNQGQALLNQVQASGGNASAAQQLQDLAREAPKPIAVMLQGVAAGGTQVATAGATQELSNAWASKVLPLCKLAFERYPLIANSPADVPVDDFAKLLAPGGMMDQFFDQYLKNFVDTTSKPWKWLAPDRVPLGLSPASLVEFERAAQIRDALFSNGKEVNVRFQLVPISMDPQLASISLDIAGQTLSWAHGPTEQGRFQWPGQGGKTLGRVTMTPGSGGTGGASGGQVIEKDGPWALLRLLDAAKVTPSGQPDKFRIAFTGGGGTATFDLNATSVNNPFTMAALRSFRCPPKL